jgi:hypothetical protein
MDATMILIDRDAELKRAHALVERLWDSGVRRSSAAATEESPAYD